MKSSDVKKLMKDVGLDTNAEADRKVLTNIVKAFEKSKVGEAPRYEPNIWRIIMKSKITKIAAAAVLIIAVLIGVNQFGNSNTAFGDVLGNIQDAKTLCWKTTLITTGQTPKISRVMVLVPYNMRVELEDGKVWILDHLRGKTLILEPSRKLAVVSSTAETSLDIYNTFKNFQNMEGFLVEEVGQKQIDGTPSIGFRLTKEDKGQEIMVWVDLETELPILIEETRTDVQSSHVFQVITNDIVFDVELDESLFNIEPPEGYVKQEMEGPLESAGRLATRAQSAANMDRILEICLIYVEENGGEWPNGLYDLVNYGLARETLVNPGQPERENGYVYLKPQGRLSPSEIILYEAYDGWDGGINVGFADGHREFIKEESDFRKRLLE